MYISANLIYTVNKAIHIYIKKALYAPTNDMKNIYRI